MYFIHHDYQKCLYNLIQKISLSDKCTKASKSLPNNYSA